MNPLLLTDSYKPSHSKIYPVGMTYMQSYFESRSPETQKIVVFGTQYILSLIEGVFVTPEQVDEANEIFKAHFGRDDVFDYDGWMYIAKDLGGKLPVNVWALPEGTVVSGRFPIMVVESTDKKVPWVVNYLETVLSQMWYPITVATYSHTIKQTIYDFLKRTSTYDDTNIRGMLGFKCHDFGYRGVSSVETAAIGAAAHLINFMGTDTLAGIHLAREYYNEPMAGFSIPASEHSTMTIGGRDGEVRAMEQMLDRYPVGLIACVSDSYDIINAIENIWGKQLRDKVMSRNGTLVIRPDSGDPVMTTHRVFESMWNTFGGTVNSKGFRVLDDHVRLIQGDGIDKDTIYDILRNFELNGIAAENIAFGSGGSLLQKHNRDTYKFAFKCNQVIVDDVQVDVAKSPMEFTATGEYVKSFKYSKSGDLIKGSDMQKVFSNGNIVRTWTFTEIRNRADSHIK